MDSEDIHIASPVTQADLSDFVNRKGELFQYLSRDSEQLEINLENAFAAFVETAHRADIAPAHRLTAINAVCALLESKPSSKLFWTHPNAASLSRAFEVTLNCFNVTKPKTVRQFILLLANTTARSDPVTNQKVVNRVLQTAFEILDCRTEQIKVKAALQVISALVHKHAISLEQLAASHHAHSKSSVETGPTSIPMDNHLKQLLKTVFYWTRSAEAAHVVGTTVELFVRSWKEEQSRATSTDGSETLPVWVDVLVQSISLQSSNLSDYQSHIFPALFKIDVVDYLEFLRYIGLSNLFDTDSHTRSAAAASNEVNVVPDLLYASLQVGKEVGLIIESDSTHLENYQLDGKVIRFPDLAFTRLLSHISPTIRLAGFSLVVASTSITRPLTKNCLNGIKQNLFQLFAETDAHIRGEVLGLLPHLLDRIRAATASLFKILLKKTDSNHSASYSNRKIITATLDSHKGFLNWLLQFLSAGLRPGAVYQRHISCLKALMILSKSRIDPSISSKHWSKQAALEISWPFQLRLFTPWVQQSLLHLLMDPFEDVRSLAAALLDISSFPLRATETKCGMDVQLATSTDYALTDFVEFIQQAEELMMLSGRADHADGVSLAYALLFSKVDAKSHSLREISQGQVTVLVTKLGIFHHLVSSLERTIRIGENDLSAAVQSFPLHGTLASLRYIIDTSEFYHSTQEYSIDHRKLWIKLHTSLITMLSRVWYCVRPILCNDAPEGHIPEDLDPESDIDTKDILSYSWRALREASSLMRAVVTRAPVLDREEPSEFIRLEEQNLQDLVKLAFTELTELRHRGAFSAAAQAFAACCSRSSRSNRPDILEMFYAKALACIRLQGSKITRRSAGLPSIVVGILSATADESFFRRVMTDLKAEAKAPAPERVAFGDPLPQVHALNCMRAVFTSALLSSVSGPYIGDALTLAAKCLDSNIWAIRNCGLMLFKSLIDQLLGTTSSQNWSDDILVKSSRFSFADAPDLLDIIVKLLRAGSDVPESPSSAFESVFPALKLVQRISLPNERRTEVRELVLRLCGSPHWHVREMAAKTYLTLLETSDIADSILPLLPNLELPQNVIHGRLFCIKYVLENFNKISNSRLGSWNKICAALRSTHDDLYRRNTSPITKAAYLDVLNILLVRHPEKILDSENATLDLHPDLTQTPTLARAQSFYLIVREIVRSEIDERQNNQMEPLIEALARERPNLCTIVLQDLIQASILQSSNGTSATLLNSLIRIVTHTEDNNLLAVSYELLAKIVENRGELKLSTNIALSLLDSSLRTHKTRSPVVVAGAVRVLGFVLDASCSEVAFTKDVSRALQGLFYNIRIIINENSPFDQRYAAACCLDGFRNLWRNPLVIDRYSMLYAHALLLAYDCLNDDDEDIRALATQTARRIMIALSSSEVSPMVPLIASRQIANVVLPFMGKGSEIVFAAIQRLCGSKLCGGTLTPSASQRLETARQSGTVLFAVEKQNLYIDDVRESIIWSRTLKQIFTQSIDREAARMLSSWVTDGLESLTNKVDAERVGPLGWTSKRDAFIFGVQVILAADVLLDWRCRSSKVPIRASHLKLSLWRLAEAGRKNGAHHMWLQLIDKILYRSTIHRVRKVGSVLLYVANGVLAR